MRTFTLATKVRQLLRQLAPTCVRTHPPYNPPGASARAWESAHSRPFFYARARERHEDLHPEDEGGPDVHAEGHRGARARPRRPRGDRVRGPRRRGRTRRLARPDLRGLRRGPAAP